MSFGRALGDLLAKIQNRDPVRNRHDELHDVLDQNDRYAALAHEVEQQRIDEGNFAIAQACGWLVE